MRTQNAASPAVEAPAPSTAPVVTTAPAEVEATTATVDTAKGLPGIVMDEKLERLIPWSLFGFQIEQNTRPYANKDGSEKTMRIATVLLLLKGSHADAPFFTTMTITYVQPAGQKPYVKAALPASQRAGGAYAVGAIKCETSAGTSAVQAWKDAMLKGPFAKWAETQDLKSLLKKGATSINMGVEMDLGGLSI